MNTKTYTCFTCLMESSTEDLCSECTAVIQFVDERTAVIKPPIRGRLIIRKETQHNDFISLIEEIVQQQSHRTFDSYSIEEENDEFLVLCNERAAERLKQSLINRIKGINRDGVHFEEY